MLDLALLSKVPGMTVFAPSSAQDLQVMVAEAMRITTGPVAIRFPNGAARRVPPEQVGSGLTARRVRQGGDVCIVGVGRMVEAAEDAALLLEDQGVSTTVWDARVVKPLDPAMICDAAAHPLVVTVEDGVRQGGAGTAVADAVAALESDHSAPPVLVLGTPDRYIAQAKPAQIHAELGLDGPGIAASVLAARRADTEEPSWHPADRS